MTPAPKRAYQIDGHGEIDGQQVVEPLGLAEGSTPEQALQTYLDENVSVYTRYRVTTASALVDLEAEPRKGHTVRRVKP